MITRTSAVEPTTRPPDPQPGDPQGWYADPGDLSSPVTWEKYWHGDHWGKEWRHRRDFGKQTDPPAMGRRASALTGFVSSAFSVAAPAAIWMSVDDSMTGDEVGGLILFAMLGCVAALIGFVCGIFGRHEAKGVVAIVLGVVGGLASFFTMGLLGLALGLGGVSAGL